MAVAAISPAAMVARISLVLIFFIPALIFLPILGLQARSWQSRGGQAMNRRFILLALLAAILVAAAVLVLAPRSDERRVGTGWVVTVRTALSLDHYKKK